MIKFFRRIRQKLLSENNFSRYLIYAVGEIILVVIGILIALQINNWNENKKDREFELKMLTELKQALTKDLENSARMQERVKIAENTTYNLLEKIYDTIEYKDSMKGEVYKLITGIQYQQTLGPYEAIKSVGLDKISNDSLRNSLIQFYDFNYPRQKELIFWYDKLYNKNFQKIKDFRKKPEIYRDQNDSISYRVKLHPSIFQDPEFLEYIVSVETWSRNTLGILNSLHPEMNELIDEIEREISKN